jgi:hypothetical protein
MSANLRLRSLGIFYIVAAVLSVLLLFFILPQGKPALGLMRYQAILLFGGFSLISGGLGVGLWRLADLARVMGLLFHGFIIVLNIIMLISGNNIVLNLSLISLNTGIMAMLYLNDPDTVPTDYPLDSGKSRLKQAISRPNFRLQAIALVYGLVSMLLVFLLIFFLIMTRVDTSAFDGISRVSVVRLFAILIASTAILGIGLWKLYDIARWLALAIHTVWLFFNLMEVMEWRAFLGALILLIINGVIVAFLSFSKPELAY